MFFGHFNSFYVCWSSLYDVWFVIYDPLKITFLDKKTAVLLTKNTHFLYIGRKALEWIYIAGKWTLEVPRHVFDPIYIPRFDLEQF